MNNDPTYDQRCSQCDHDEHVCGGCGEPLRHDGKLHDGTNHPDCT